MRTVGARGERGSRDHDKGFSTRVVRPANSRPDLWRLRQVFSVTTPPWQQALGRELDFLVQRGSDGSQRLGCSNVSP
jgi:hypothetical protein